MFNSIIDRHAPLRSMSSKENRLSDEPWITRGILTSIKLKINFSKQYFKNKNFDTDKSKKRTLQKVLKQIDTC